MKPIRRLVAILSIALPTATALGLGLLAGVRGFLGPPVIVVVNDSGRELQDVTVSGDGARWEEHIGTLRAGESVAVVAHAQGESGLRIDFDARGERVSIGDLAYFDAHGLGCTAVIEVEENLGVNAEVETYSFHRKRLGW